MGNGWFNLPQEVFSYWTIKDVIFVASENIKFQIHPPYIIFKSACHLKQYSPKPRAGINAALPANSKTII